MPSRVRPAPRRPARRAELARPVRPAALIASDPAAPIDLPAWCHLTGHTYLGPVPGAAVATYALRLAETPVPTGQDSPWRRDGG
ncbi:sulfurtransferase TusA family protein [Sphaerisporangium fuscum]|uniref:sulfurtransferase TusA family protein n=1 Tax=Sphaerisporangium fuscum TaxID=2835868 RepID=UPI0020299AA1|nr:sulfurtransferase TusA family protein [Sphaerisporangium fuscum]